MLAVLLEVVADEAGETESCDDAGCARLPMLWLTARDGGVDAGIGSLDSTVPAAAGRMISELLRGISNDTRVTPPEVWRLGSLGAFWYCGATTDALMMMQAHARRYELDDGGREEEWRRAHVLVLGLDDLLEVAWVRVEQERDDAVDELGGIDNV